MIGWRQSLRRGVVSAVWSFVGVGSLAGCTPGGVGDPCVPEEEYLSKFSGFSLDEVSTESRSFQCATRVCLVNHFRGRVSCPYGQVENDASATGCTIPGATTRVEAAVDPQLLKRRADDHVYCSCRCDGPETNARYCECPSGFSCTEVVPTISKGKDQLVGSYCIKEGTQYVKGTPNDACDRSLSNCDD